MRKNEGLKGGQTKTIPVDGGRGAKKMQALGKKKSPLFSRNRNWKWKRASCSLFT